MLNWVYIFYDQPYVNQSVSRVDARVETCVCMLCGQLLILPLFDIIQSSSRQKDFEELNNRARRVLGEVCQPRKVSIDVCR